MTLPRSFKSWAVVGGKVVPIVVDADSAGFLVCASLAGDDVDLVVTTGMAEYAESRAWAVKALAWLTAEAGKPVADVDFAAAAEDNLFAALERMRKSPTTNLGRAADAAWRALSGEIEYALRAAHMEDLVDRCAEEMRRQAEEVVKTTPPEWHGCTNPAGHSFDEGVCEDCEMRL